MSRVTIVAFDGIIADTLPRRAAALADAVIHEYSTHKVELQRHDLLAPLSALLPGRTFGEAVTIAIGQLPALQHISLGQDLTAHDLIALRAQRSWSEAVAHGVPLFHGVIERLQREAARGQRIVARSDSQRREVEPLLRLAGLEDIMMFVRCSDDLPHSIGVPTLQGSYDAIDTRLNRQRIARANRDAVEVSRGTAAFALGLAETSRTSL